MSPRKLIIAAGVIALSACSSPTEPLRRDALAPTVVADSITDDQAARDAVRGKQKPTIDP